MKLFENKWGLSVSELVEISKLYEAHCTAEVVMESYGIEDIEEAVQIGYEARDIMYNSSDEEIWAIEHVLEKRKESGNYAD